MGLFRRRTAPEARSAGGGGDFFNGVVAELQAQASTRSGDAGATAAIEAVSGQLSRAFADAEVVGADWLKETVTPAFLAQVGRDLIRSGASLHRVDVNMDGQVRLWPQAQWFWHEGRSSDPSTWMVRCTEYGPSGSVTHLLPWTAVIWQTWGLSTTTPWVGRGPASWAALTAKTAAETERSLGDEASGPLANLVTYPQDGGDGEDGDPLAMLKTDIAGARGKALLVETTAAGLGEGRASAPQRDWVPSRLGPEPPDSMVASVDAAFARMVAACGSTISLFNDSDGTSQREALRRWHMGTVRPVSVLLAAELTVKLDTPVALRFDAYATDLAGRASAFKSLVTAGMDITEAVAVAGLMVDDD